MSGRVSARCMTAARMSARRMTAAASWMAGSQRIRRKWHATESGRGSESDECSMKHVTLLVYGSNKKFVVR
jgi:hypothetical protein